MLKFFLKIWPALIPIAVYVFWIFVIERFLIGKLLAKFLKKKTEFEAEKVVGEKSTAVKKPGIFSLQNSCFVVMLYMSFALAILILIVTAFS